MSKEKINFIEDAIFKLGKFSVSLSEHNLVNFEAIKSQILENLNENERLRFGRIEFFEENIDFNEIMDDLPF